MSRLIWDAVGEKFYEMGTKMGVLYPMNNTGAYDKGVAWNGLTAVTESPSGAEETKLYADDIKPECFLDQSCDSAHYPEHDYHTMYIAEVEHVYRAE